ncbi:hypothetical protein SLS60_005466 [Paraconiothyrium brasiliense]|uniref:Protein kinase domain-containing protein n=1 Tax=Paraconiothyrium brasiliense TaxID=300254 RepID=A0ABR3RHF2_9PLEO
MEQDFQGAACFEGNVCLPGAATHTPTKGPAEESPQQPDIQHADETATPEAFFTATPGYMSHLETPGRLNPNTEYGRTLQEQKLLVAKEVELNWSGRGQHVEFKENEHIPLEVEKTIGYSATALIESVRCRRIRLARKSIPCKRKASLRDLVPEVSYLHRLRHPHIIQMVGTYLQKNTFSILLYPVATGDLTKFLDEWSPKEDFWYGYGSPSEGAQRDLSRFFFCLTHALRYMHSQGIRHMDIKPSNILVHERRTLGRPTVRSVYL